MAYAGTCALVFFCDGPTAHIVSRETREQQSVRE